MILGIDTSTDRLSLALVDTSTIATYHQMLDRRHGETVLPALQQLLDEQKYSMKDVTGVVVGLGPGSFTGVRIGIATAIGLAQSLNLPVVGLSSYLGIAANSGADKVIVIGDARREAVYAAGYEKVDDQWVTFFKESLTTVAALKEIIGEQDIVLSGPDGEQFFNVMQNDHMNLRLIDQEKRLPDASVLVHLGSKQVKDGGQSYEALQPIYLRRTQAEEMFENKK